MTLLATTLVTGMIGWTAYFADRGGARLGDAAYATLLALTGDAAYLRDPDLNGWLLVTRFTGLLTTISAVISVAAVVLAARTRRLAACLRRGHSVVIGASGFVVEHRARHGKVTVFDTAEAIEAGRGPLWSWRVLELSDRMTQDVATGASLGAPAQVLFGDADAITNIERAAAWMRRAPPRLSARADLVLRIEDNSVARDLDLLDRGLAKAQVVSRVETVARSLVTAMAPGELALSRGQACVHVVLVGMGRTNLAVAEELALRCHHPKLGTPRLTFVDGDTSAGTARLRAERPGLLNPDLPLDGPRVETIALDALECRAPGAASALLDCEAACPMTAIVVSAGPDTRNTAIALRLRQAQMESLRLRAPIYARRRTSASIAPTGPWPLTGGIVAFGGQAMTAGDVALERSYQAQAKAVHDTWRNAPDVERRPENAWENLSSTHRRSSYRAAMFAIDMLYAAGFAPPVGSISPEPCLLAAAGHDALGDAALVEDLARVEHGRWNTERRLEGFRTAPDARRDPEKKLHPLIVPYRDLAPAQADKDRRNVRAVLHGGIERHERAPQASCWRAILRIGLIGPLLADAATLAPQIDDALEQLLRARPGTGDRTLEILTPNAPGFDRLAAVALADGWLSRSGRPCRVVTLNAAGTAVVDQIAADGVTAAGHGEDRDRLTARFAEESRRVAALEGAGHVIADLDFRPLGLSDAELDADRDHYLEAIRRTQDHILGLADEMMINTKGGVWSMAAAERWTDERSRKNLLA